ncbi:hemicentin-1-like [Anneissia japonica]|uniref:hemicentin-1-like n=1 Tax=Anneissia japonica TaxID=1529436 RepID=UPI00142561A8|nr:hemicentin-1-like [Anneissia japonica]
MAAVATRVIPLLMLLLSLRPVVTNDIYLSLQPEGKYIRRGENATFICLHNLTNTVNINGTNYASLYKNNSTGEFQLLNQQQHDNFSSETVFSLPDVDLDDQGTYKCEVNSSDGIFNSDDVTLTIAYLEKPNLTASRHYLLIEETANLTCSKPSGNPPPNNISWFKDGSPLVSSASNGEISLLSVNDSGSYQCRAESNSYVGSDGMLSNQVDVQVFEVASSVTEAKEGDPSVVLMCEINPIINGINGSKWTKITNTSTIINIQDSTDKYVITQNIGQYNLTIINTVDRSDNGTYRCHFIIQDAKGLENFTANVQLIVNYIDPPVVQSVIKGGLKWGQSANITCNISDAKPLVDSVTWFRDGQPIINSTSSDVTEDGRTLKFLSFTEAEKGEYTCRAESEVFQGTSSKNSSNSIHVDFIFLGEPQIKVSSNEINIGETVELTCVLPDGNPPPNEVIWLKDGHQIGNKSINKHSRGNNDVITLKIPSVNTETNGEYSCRVLSEAYKQQGGLESNVTQTITVVVEKQDEGDKSLNIYLIIAVSIAKVVLITAIILVYICCFRPIRLAVLEQQITDAKASLIVECNYKPRLARADSVQWVTPSGSLPLMRFPSCFNTFSERKYLKEIPSDDKIELQAKGIDRMKVASNGRGTLYLEINGVTAFDSGEYTCIVSRRNGKKTATHSGIMTVHSKLIVAVGEAFSNNDSLTISCTCLPFNEPVDSFIWFLADETGEVQQGHGSALASSTDIASRGRYSCACEDNTCYLRISEPTEEDARNYQCKVIRKYDNIPFQGIIVLTKDSHTLEWKVSQFVPQVVPQEAKSTDSLTSGERLLSKDTMRTGDIQVVYEVTDESIVTANGAINGGDKFVVEDGENIIDNNQCNNDIETKPNTNEQTYNTNGGEVSGNDDGGDGGATNADHDDVTPTETERDVCKDSDVELAYSDQETSEQGNAKPHTKANIKANNGYDMSADIDEQLILHGDSEEFTGNNIQGLEARAENSYSDGESSAQSNEKTQDNVEMGVDENGDVNKWLDLKDNIEVNIETVALDEVNDNPIKLNTNQDVGDSECVKTIEISNFTE